MNYTLVGAFVLVLGAALIAGVLWLASGGALQKKYDLYAAIENESVAGLNLNAPVKYNGVDVGKVRSVTLAPGNPEQINLLFAIERGTPVRESTIAVLKTQGLTGIAYVELSGGAAGSPPLRAAAGEKYPLIKTKPSLGARLENMLTTVLAKLDSTAGNINSVLSDENRAAFRNILANLAAVTQTFAARKATLDAGITNASRTLDNSAQASAELGPVIERIGHAADAVEKMGKAAALAAASAGRTLDASGPDIKRFTAETLPEFERVLGEMAALAASLRRLSERMEGSPGGLLLGRRPVPPGPGEETGKGAPK